jgi:hypothetical protein
MLTGGAAGLPWNGRRRRRFGRTAASLVHVIQHDVDQKVCRIVDTSSLDCKAAQVVRETVPSIELAEVDIVNLESRDIFESMQRYCTVERELLKSGNEASFVVWRESETRNLRERRVQVFNVLLKQSFLLFLLGVTDRGQAKR